MFKPVRFTILVVLFRLKPGEASTLCALAKSKEALRDSRIIVRDNSPEPLNEADRKELNGMLDGVAYSYVYNQGRNASLSEIYNETIRELEKGTFLVIFDHDSKFDADFFIKAAEAINANEDVALFLPLIYCKHRLISPSKMWYFKGSLWKEEHQGLLLAKGTTASNSGMVISTDYLLEKYPGYDERLNFYGTDNDFMWKYENQNKHLFVFPYRMEHSVDFYNPDEPFERMVGRLHDVSHSLYILMEGRGWWTRPLAALYIRFYAAKLALKRRDFRYLFVR